MAKRRHCGGRADQAISLRIGSGEESAVIYMVEMDMRLGDREAEWHAWYLAHIRVLLSVPGFRASQRFQSLLPCPAPYLALHQVDSSAIFESLEYRSRGGPSSTGEWRSLHLNWRRNFLEGLDETPDVAQGATLLRLENARDVDLPAGIAVTWTKVAGLDRDAAEFGLAAIADAAPAMDLARTDPRVRLYRPISEKLWEESGK
jgi:hypothetical protein